MEAVVESMCRSELVVRLCLTHLPIICHYLCQGHFKVSQSHICVTVHDHKCIIIVNTINSVTSRSVHVCAYRELS